MEQGLLDERIEAIEVAAALLLEARALTHTQNGRGRWPSRGLPALSASEALSRVWADFPSRTVRAREGLALARRTLERASQEQLHGRMEAQALVDLIDEAVVDLVDAPN